MNILSLLICLDQGLIPGHMCQNTKLNLGIVCIKKNAAIFRYKNFTDQSPKFHTYRDILKIRLCTADPAGCSNGLVKGRMDPAILIDHTGKTICICGLQFCQLPVFQDIFNNGLLFCQLLQHICSCGITGFGLLSAFDPHFLEKDHSQLFW